MCNVTNLLWWAPAYARLPVPSDASPSPTSILTTMNPLQASFHTIPAHLCSAGRLARHALDLVCGVAGGSHRVVPVAPDRRQFCLPFLRRGHVVLFGQWWRTGGSATEFAGRQVKQRCSMADGCCSAARRWARPAPGHGVSSCRHTARSAWFLQTEQRNTALVRTSRFGN